MLIYVCIIKKNTKKKKTKLDTALPTIMFISNFKKKLLGPCFSIINTWRFSHIL